jgi:hypothetical protein
VYGAVDNVSGGLSSKVTTAIYGEAITENIQNSTEYKVGSTVAEVAQYANPAGLAKNAVKEAAKATAKYAMAEAKAAAADTVAEAVGEATGMDVSVVVDAAQAASRAKGTAKPGGPSANTAAVASEKGKKEYGSYTNKHESGKEYHGQGDKKRSQKSAKEKEAENNDPHVATEWTPADSRREAMKEESRRLDAGGGKESDKNYNKIESPGKKYRKQDKELP